MKYEIPSKHNFTFYRWCVRHLYIPVVKMGYSSRQASTIVFLISAFFHEYLVGNLIFDFDFNFTNIKNTFLFIEGLCSFAYLQDMGIPWNDGSNTSVRHIQECGTFFGTPHGQHSSLGFDYTRTTVVYHDVLPRLCYNTFQRFPQQYCLPRRLIHAPSQIHIQTYKWRLLICRYLLMTILFATCRFFNGFAYNRYITRKL